MYFSLVLEKFIESGQKRVCKILFKKMFPEGFEPNANK